MTTIQQGTLLEVLKKKMRSMKEELEVAKEAADEAQARLQEEIRRREEVRNLTIVYRCLLISLLYRLFIFFKTLVSTVFTIAVFLSPTSSVKICKHTDILQTHSKVSKSFILILLHAFIL